MASPVVEANGVSHRFEDGTTALEGVSLVVAPGERVVILGPSGAGKTTLLSVLAGHQRPTEGSVRVAGRDVPALRGRDLDRFRARDVRLVPQHDNLLGYLTALENVQLVGRLALGAAPGRREVLDRFARYGLAAELADRRPSQLSAGQRQRIAVVRATIGSPAVILADEPTARLDRDTSATVIGELDEAAAAVGAALVVVTHDAEVAGRIRHRPLHMVDGRLEADVRVTPDIDLDAPELAVGQGEAGPAGSAPGAAGAASDGRMVREVFGAPRAR